MDLLNLIKIRKEKSKETFSSKNEIKRLDNTLAAFAQGNTEAAYDVLGVVVGKKTDRRLEKLKKDGFIYIHKDSGRYKITMDGILFHNKGGYRKSVKYERRKQWNENVKFFFSIITVIGVIVGIWLSLSEYNKQKEYEQLEKRIEILEKNTNPE